MWSQGIVGGASGCGQWVVDILFPHNEVFLLSLSLCFLVASSLLSVQFVLFKNNNN